MRQTGRGAVRRLLFAASLALSPWSRRGRRRRAAAAADRLPNLRAASPSDFQIVDRRRSPLLRFTSILVNLGAGPIGGPRPATELVVTVDGPAGHRQRRRRGAARRHRRDAALRGRWPRPLARRADDGLPPVVQPRHAGRPQDGVLLLRHDPVVPEPAALAEQLATTANRGAAADGAHLADRDLGRLGGHLPLELRVPVDRHHRPAGRDVHGPRRCPTRTTGSSRPTRPTGAAGRR